MTKGDLDLFFF